MNSLSDNALMIKVKEGDLHTLGLLYERHKKKLFGFFYNLGNNPSISEDLVQNVFYRMLKYKDSFASDGQFGAWMFRVARNVNYDHHQKASKRGFSEEKNIENVNYAMEDPINETQNKKDNSLLLRKALALLSEEKRQLLVLCKFQGLKFSELAQVLDISEGAAKVRVHRALKELKSVFVQLEKQ
ncbi:MAG: RNA polymerase sigma factor [Bacteroidota bacterium]